MNVRLRCCQMLSYFMTCLPDRYDHQQRLLPYLLSFFCDSCDKIRNCAFLAIENIGQQYETENSDSVIERRQFGVDGDTRCNYEDALPHPFKVRPRLGSRLFVRSNTKRFFMALLGELTSWISKTRERSSNLLQVLVIYCEEHLTMDISQTLTLIAQAVKLAMSEPDDKDCRSLLGSILNATKLIGRYVDPETYVPFLLPRVCGQVESGTTFAEGGIHSEMSKASFASVLAAMIQGSLPVRLEPHSLTILEAITSDDIIGNFAGVIIKREALRVLIHFLRRLDNTTFKLSQFDSKELHGQDAKGIQSHLKLFKDKLETIQKKGNDTEILSLATEGMRLLT